MSEKETGCVSKYLVHSQKFTTIELVKTNLLEWQEFKIISITVYY